jgi:hypothetical protein
MGCWGVDWDIVLSCLLFEDVRLAVMLLMSSR